MYLKLSVLAIVLAAGCFGQARDPPYQVRYAANLNLADAAMEISNTGASMTSSTNGILCANVYVFDPAGQMLSCGSYAVPPNVTIGLSVKKDLINTTPVPKSVSIRVLGTISPASGTSTSCAGAASSAGTGGNPLAVGLLAYGTSAHLKQNAAQQTVTGEAIIIKPPLEPPAKPAHSSTGTAFSASTLSATELNKLNTLCSSLVI